jgi:hypothetical protein
MFWDGILRRKTTLGGESGTLCPHPLADPRRFPLAGFLAAWRDTNFLQKRL